MKFGRAAAIRWTTFLDMVVFDLRLAIGKRGYGNLRVQARYGRGDYMLDVMETGTQTAKPAVRTVTSDPHLYKYTVASYCFEHD